MVSIVTESIFIFVLSKDSTRLDLLEPVVADELNEQNRIFKSVRDTFFGMQLTET